MKLMKIVRLVRFPNLILVAGVPFILRYGIMKPVLRANDMCLQLSNFDFTLLVFSSLCIAAAAYIINDYFDQRADWVNRPEKVVLGTAIPRRWAIGLNFGLNTLAVLVGVYLSLKIHMPEFIPAFIVVPGLALLYSAVLKKKTWTGNWVAAGFVAMVPLLVVVFEIPLLQQKYQLNFFDLNENLGRIVYWFLIYGFFTFFTVLLYEGFKDCQSYQGDLESGNRTLIVLMNPFSVKIYFSIICLILLIPSAWLVYRYMPDLFTTVYYLAGIALPLLAVLFFIWKGSCYSGNSKYIWLLRLVMLAGILYPLFIGVQINL